MLWIRSGDGTPHLYTSAILEIDFAFISKNPTDVSQFVVLAEEVSNYNLYSKLLYRRLPLVRTNLLISSCHIIKYIQTLYVHKGFDDIKRSHHRGSLFLQTTLLH